MAKKTFTPIPPMAELPPAEDINVKELLEKYLSGEIDLICVLGPTASGKTRYAVNLARQINELLAGPLPPGYHEHRGPCHPRHESGGTTSEAQWWGERSERPRVHGNPEEGSEAPRVNNNPEGESEHLRVHENPEGESGLMRVHGNPEGGSEQPRGHENPEGGAEIISADSRQVYRGMDIGTGKDLSEYEEIPYHLMDIVDAGTKYNIFEYQRDFEKAYKDIVDRGGIPILCGGSGLYIEAATCGYSLPEVPPDPDLRAELEKKSDEELIAQLASLKPLHNNTDYDTRKRLIRALEIAIYEAEHPVQRTTFLPKNTYYIGTLVSRDERNARIDRRLDARIEEGMIEEIRGLVDGTHPALAPDHKPIPAEDLIYYGLEYKFVTLHVTGELTLEEMRTQLATAIHQFAKRQMTWFRGMERKGITIHWTNV